MFNKKIQKQEEIDQKYFLLRKELITIEEKIKSCMNSCVKYSQTIRIPSWIHDVFRNFRQKVAYQLQEDTTRYYNFLEIINDTENLLLNLELKKNYQLMKKGWE